MGVCALQHLWLWGMEVAGGGQRFWISYLEGRQMALGFLG